MTRTTEQFIEEFLALIDPALAQPYTAVLFGSVARGQQVEGASDINLLLLLPDAGPPTLRALGPAFATWHRAGLPTPLLLTRAEWARAGDSYPLEVADMRGAYRVLRGTDPLRELAPDRGTLRVSLERELRGKLLLLRRGFVAAGDDPARLGALVARSASTALFLCRSLLVLVEQPVPADPDGVVQAAARQVGVSPAALLEVVRHRHARDWPCPVALYEGYLDAVAQCAAFVDSYSR